MKKTALRAKRRKIKLTFAARRFCRGGYQPPAFFGRSKPLPYRDINRIAILSRRGVLWTPAGEHSSPLRSGKASSCPAAQIPDLPLIFNRKYDIIKFGKAVGLWKKQLCVRSDAKSSSHSPHEDFVGEAISLPLFFGRIISSPTLRFEKFMLRLLKYIE